MWREAERKKHPPATPGAALGREHQLVARIQRREVQEILVQTDSVGRDEGAIWRDENSGRLLAGGLPKPRLDDTPSKSTRASRRCLHIGNTCHIEQKASKNRFQALGQGVGVVKELQGDGLAHRGNVTPVWPGSALTGMG